MRKYIVGLVCVLVGAIAVAENGVVVSAFSKTVAVEVKHEWRTILFVASPDTGEISVRAVYEAVTREDGLVKSRDIIREASVNWTQATNIAPELEIVRQKFNAALPTLLTNTP